MSKYHKLIVKNIIKETADTRSIVFDIPNNLSDEFKYTQGQYLSLKKNINGEDVIRAYSLSSAPYEDELKVSVKKLEGGKFSTFATEKLSIGDELEVFPPRGNFYSSLSPSHVKTYVAFAAGSGITPVISIIKATLKVEPKSNFTLFYGNKDNDSIIFKDELEQLSVQYINRLNVHHILSREDGVLELNKGRLSAEKCYHFEKEDLMSFDKMDEVFLCGPREMVDSISGLLEEKGINKSNIHFELFFAAPSSPSEESSVESDFDVSDITLIIDGDEFNFELPKGKFVLDVAIEKDLDVPFSCKSGVCCTCKAKVMSGEVAMANNYALDDDEVEDGYVLTCQTTALTKHVILDMDE